MNTFFTIHCLTLLVINMIYTYVQVLTLYNYLSLSQSFAIFISLNATGGFWSIFNICLCVDRAFRLCLCDCFEHYFACLSSWTFENALLVLHLVSIF